MQGWPVGKEGVSWILGRPLGLGYLGCLICAQIVPRRGSTHEENMQAKSAGMAPACLDVDYGVLGSNFQAACSVMNLMDGVLLAGVRRDETSWLGVTRVHGAFLTASAAGLWNGILGGERKCICKPRYVAIYQSIVACQRRCPQ